MTRHKRNRNRRSKKNILSRGLTGLKSTTKKIIPGVKSGIEGVGRRVVGTARNSIPVAQNSVRNLFGMFGLSNKKRMSRRTRRKR